MEIVSEQMILIMLQDSCGVVGRLVEYRTFNEMEVQVQSTTVSSCCFPEKNTSSALLLSTLLNNKYHSVGLRGAFVHGNELSDENGTQK